MSSARSGPSSDPSGAGSAPADVLVLAPCPRRPRANVADKAPKQFPDQWLVPTVSELLGKEKVEELLAAEGAKEKDAKETVWETLVAVGAATDDQVLAALSKRFH